MTTLLQPRGILALTLFALLSAGPAFAANILLTFDENGHGSETLPDGTMVPLLTSTFLVDPGTHLPALSYLLLASITDGFVGLQEPGSQTISDVLHFTGESAYFYSDPREPGTASDLADTAGFTIASILLGLGGPIIPEVGSEGANGALYVPGATDPGFSRNHNEPVSYKIISDAPTVVPEPSSLILLVTGIGLAGVAWRRQHR